MRRSLRVNPKAATFNDLYRASNILKPVMFADDTNLFGSEKHIKTLFQTANIELEKITIWFQANKLSLKKVKQSLLFFINSGIKIITSKASNTKNKQF